MFDGQYRLLMEQILSSVIKKAFPSTVLFCRYMNIINYSCATLNSGTALNLYISERAIIRFLMSIFGQF